MTEESKKIIRDALQHAMEISDLHCDKRRFSAALAELDNPDKAAEHNADIACNMARKHIELQARAEKAEAQADELDKLCTGRWQSLCELQARAEKAEAELKKYQDQEEALFDTVAKIQTESAVFKARAASLAEALDQIDIVEKGHDDWLDIRGPRSAIINIGHNGQIVQQAKGEWKQRRDKALAGHGEGRLAPDPCLDDGVQWGEDGFDIDCSGQPPRKVVPLALLEELVDLVCSRPDNDFDNKQSIIKIFSRYGYEVTE